MAKESKQGVTILSQMLRAGPQHTYILLSVCLEMDQYFQSGMISPISQVWFPNNVWLNSSSLQYASSILNWKLKILPRKKMVGEGRGRAERLLIVEIVKGITKLKAKTVVENICMNMNFCRIKSWQSTPHFICNKIFQNIKFTKNVAEKIMFHLWGNSLTRQISQIFFQMSQKFTKRNKIEKI